MAVDLRAAEAADFMVTPAVDSMGVEEAGSMEAVDSMAVEDFTGVEAMAEGAGNASDAKSFLIEYEKTPANSVRWRLSLVPSISYLR